MKVIWKLLTETSGSSPDFHLSFNCLFLRYPIKTEEMECLILNKSRGRDGKRVCHSERMFLDSNPRGEKKSPWLLWLNGLRAGL